MQLILIALLPLIALGLLGNDSLNQLEPGLTQYIIILSNISRSEDRISLHNELDPPNKYMVNTFTTKHLNMQPEIGQRYYDGLNVDLTFKNIFLYTKTLDIRISNNQPSSKQSILSKLQERFGDTNFTNTILYFSGHSEQFNGGWIVSIANGTSTAANWDSMIIYREIADLWKGRPDKIKSRQLHVIIEASYSGLWTKRCYQDVDFEDLSVMGATQIGQKAHDVGFGGYFTYNLMQAIRPFSHSEFLIQQSLHAKQNMTSIGLGVLLDRQFQLRMFYSDWKQLFANQNKNLAMPW